MWWLSGGYREDGVGVGVLGGDQKTGKSCAVPLSLLHKAPYLRTQCLLGLGRSSVVWIGFRLTCHKCLFCILAVKRADGTAQDELCPKSPPRIPI